MNIKITIMQDGETVDKFYPGATQRSMDVALYEAWTHFYTQALKNGQVPSTVYYQPGENEDAVVMVVNGEGGENFQLIGEWK